MRLSEQLAPLTEEEKSELEARITNNRWSTNAQAYIAYQEYITRLGDCSDSQLFQLSHLSEQVSDAEIRLLKAYVSLPSMGQYNRRVSYNSPLSQQLNNREQEQTAHAMTLKEKLLKALPKDLHVEFTVFELLMKASGISYARASVVKAVEDEFGNLF